MLSLEKWLNSKYLLQENALLSSIDLELSRRCNQQCLYCFTNAGEALPYELTLREIKRVILEGKEIGLKQVVIVGGGEPLLYRELEEVIDFITYNGLRILLLTNGLLIDREKADYFYRKKVYLCIKRNAFDQAHIHDDLVGRPGSFAQVTTVLNMLIDMGYAHSHNSMLAVESIICRQNKGEISKLWRWARSNNILPFMELVTPQGRARDNQHLLITQDEASQLFSELSQIDKYEYGYEWIPLPPIVGFPCRRNYYSCYITSVGDVLPCSGLDIPVGNIRENRLQEILENSVLIKKLRQAEVYLEGKCGQCDFKKGCYGCRGKAFCATGNPFAQDPLCWY